MLPMLGGQLDGNEREACLSLDGGVAHRHCHHWKMGAPINVCWNIVCNILKIVKEFSVVSHLKRMTVDGLF